jgi:hypothetical protein
MDVQIGSLCDSTDLDNDSLLAALWHVLLPKVGKWEDVREPVRTAQLGCALLDRIRQPVKDTRAVPSQPRHQTTQPNWQAGRVWSPPVHLRALCATATGSTSFPSPASAGRVDVSQAMPAWPREPAASPEATLFHRGSRSLARRALTSPLSRGVARHPAASALTFQGLASSLRGALQRAPSSASKQALSELHDSLLYAMQQGAVPRGAVLEGALPSELARWVSPGRLDSVQEDEPLSAAPGRPSEDAGSGSGVPTGASHRRSTSLPGEAASPLTCAVGPSQPFNDGRPLPLELSDMTTASSPLAARVPRRATVSGGPVHPNAHDRHPHIGTSPPCSNFDELCAPTSPAAEQANALMSVDSSGSGPDILQAPSPEANCPLGLPMYDGNVAGLALYRPFGASSRNVMRSLSGGPHHLWNATDQRDTLITLHGLLLRINSFRTEL